MSTFTMVPYQREMLTVAYKRESLRITCKWKHYITTSIWFLQCSNEMLQILRLARRDGDEWVRLFASVLAPFPNNQTISVDQITEGGLEGVQEDICDAREYLMEEHCNGQSSREHIIDGASNLERMLLS